VSPHHRIACAAAAFLGVLTLTAPEPPARAVAAGGRLLDGRSFTVQINDKDLVKGSKPIDDTFTFAAGKLVSDWLRGQGSFPEIAYTARGHGEAIAFTAHATSKRRGEITVIGTAQEGGHGLISGTLSLRRKGEKVRQLEFSGMAR
jgi:hypothetical protein